MQSKRNTIKAERININSLIINSILDFNLYKKIDNRYYIILKAGEVFLNELKVTLHLEDHEFDAIYIEVESKDKYSNYVLQHMKKISNAKECTLKGKANVIYSSASHIINGFFEKPESKELFAQSKSLVSGTIDFILSDEHALKSIMEIGSHDYYTYTHSLDVSVYAIGFANYLGFSLDELSKIGESALMHDIGKSKIASEIINKKGTLDVHEYETMKQHPIFSDEILRFHEIDDIDILKGARHHHEKIDGNGYPDKLSNHNIHLFAKIIAISDIFSALTTKRTYKAAYSSYETLMLMKSKMENELDTKLLGEFVKFNMNIALK